MTLPSGDGENQRHRRCAIICTVTVVLCSTLSACPSAGQEIMELYRVPAMERSSASCMFSLAFATSLFEEGDYFRAIGEYKRSLFDGSCDASGCSMTYMIGMSYVLGEQWDDAYSVFDKLSASPGCDSLRELAGYKIGQTLFSQGELQLSATRFELIQGTQSPARLSIQSALMHSWCNLRMRRWSDALSDCGRVAGSQPLSDYRDGAARLCNYLQGYRRIPHRSPDLSGVMSALIPGSGQMYCGELTNGVMALLINGALGYIAYDSFRKHYYAGEIISAYFGLTFYLGNIYAAKVAAHRYNERAERSFADQGEVILKSLRLQLDARRDGARVVLTLDPFTD